MMASRSLLRHRQVATKGSSILRRLSNGAKTDVRALQALATGNENNTDSSIVPLAAVLLAAVASIRRDGEDELTKPPTGVRFYPMTKCEAAPAVTPGWGRPAVGIGSKSTNRKLTPTSQPRNVMLHRMRSIRARHLKEKYNVDFKTVLGEGAYGSVHSAKLRSTGEKVALKKISKRYTNTVSFRNETDALLRIYDNGGHPNISGLRDMYEDYGYFYLILDLVSGGELFDHLINYGAYSEADAARLMREVASALSFLHGVGVVHADLKPENLLLCSKKKSDGTIKLIDFGCAVVSQDNYHDYDDDDDQYDDEEMRPKNKTSQVNKKLEVSSTGTTAYWCPERFRKGMAPDPASDMWSVGVILFIMLCGVHPFDTQGMSTDEEIEKQIKKDPSPPIGPLTDHLSPSAIDLIKKLMAKDPKDRLTAQQMLQHPWIRGETATTSIMADSDKKLSRFKELRDKIEAGIFAVLVSHGHRDKTLSEFSPANGTDKKYERASVDIMKRAFEVFDAEGKGFVSPDDLGRVVGEMTGSKLSSDDQENMIAAMVESDSGMSAPPSLGLSLSDFAKSFSRLKHKHFPRGHVIFKAGDVGDAMYFINAGKVEIRTKKGQLISILRQGDFFGEGSLLDEDNCRYTTARCGTPVDVIKISREEFNRYIASSISAKSELKVKWKARSLLYAKNLIRLQKNVKIRTLKKGDVVYQQGNDGKSMYLVDEKDGGLLDVFHDGVQVFTLKNGETFGESSLIFSRPRSSTVVCASETCKLHEMIGSDFLAVLKSSPEHLASMRDMARKRYFKRAMKSFARRKNLHTYSVDDMVAAFHDADSDGSGHLSIDEVRVVMHKMDPDFPESEIKALLKFIDVDEDGLCSLEEFMRIFRVFENMEHKSAEQH